MLNELCLMLDWRTSKRTRMINLPGRKLRFALNGKAVSIFSTHSVGMNLARRFDGGIVRTKPTSSRHRRLNRFSTVAPGTDSVARLRARRFDNLCLSANLRYYSFHSETSLESSHAAVHLHSFALCISSHRVCALRHLGPARRRRQNRDARCQGILG